MQETRYHLTITLKDNRLYLLIMKRRTKIGIKTMKFSKLNQKDHSWTIQVNKIKVFSMEAASILISLRLKDLRIKHTEQSSGMQ